MGFYKLPNEMLSHIISFVAPEDLCNFVCTCPLVYKLSEKHLQRYRELRDKWRKVEVGNHPGGRAPYYHPLHLLCEIQRDPSIGDYIQDIKLLITSYYWWYYILNDSIYLNAHLELCKNCDIDFFVSQCPELDTKMRDNWADLIRKEIEKHEPPWNSSVLLLHFLPNLTHLRLEGKLKRFKLSMQSLIDWVHAQPYTSTQSTTVPLRKVSYLSYHKCEYDFENDPIFQELGDLILLPSLRVVEGHNFINFMDHTVLPSALEPGKVSTVKELKIYRMLLEPAALALLIAPMTQLESFQCEFRAEDVKDCDLNKYRDDFVGIMSPWLRKRKLFAVTVPGRFVTYGVGGPINFKESKGHKLILRRYPDLDL